MSTPTSFAKAKNLILTRLEQDKSQMPASEWEKKRYILDKTWQTLSINELIEAVERETPLGVKFVKDKAKKLGYIVI